MRTTKRQLSDAEVDGAVLEQISNLMTAHVRFEEKGLFPILERLIPEETLVELAMVGRRGV